MINKFWYFIKLEYSGWFSFDIENTWRK